jgi:hypothetical protein
MVALNRIKYATASSSESPARELEAPGNPLETLPAASSANQSNIIDLRSDGDESDHDDSNNESMGGKALSGVSGDGIVLEVRSSR